MNFKCLLKLEGASEPNAVLVEDSGMEYPILLEQLHMPDMFKMAKDSGWKFAAYPYDFVKDGVHIPELPVNTDYKVEPAVLERLFASIGEKMTIEQLKDNLDLDVVSGIDVPTEYTIKTRDEFIKWIHTIGILHPNFDFKPINYFVSPEARFSIDEFNSPQYSEYIKILTQRRRMTYIQFKNLCNWAISTGKVKQDADAIDILKFYWSYGIDGLNIPVQSCIEQMSDYDLVTATSRSKPRHRVFTDGFVLSDGTLLTPPAPQGKQWQPFVSNDEEYQAWLNEATAAGEAIVKKFFYRAPCKILVFDTPIGELRVNSDRAILKSLVLPNLTVVSPYDNESTMTIDLMVPSKADELQKDMKIRALAKFIHDYKTDNRDVSSYRALVLSGYTEEDAIISIGLQCGAISEAPPTGPASKQPAVEDGRVISTHEVKAYLGGKLHTFIDSKFLGVNYTEEMYEECVAIVQQIVDGSLNIDKVDDGKTADMIHSDFDSVCTSIKTVHEVMNIPLENIHQLIINIQPGDQKVTFTDGNIKHSISIVPNVSGYNGYQYDLHHYRLKCADEADNLAFIEYVAKEMGADEPAQHVAVQLALAPKGHKGVEKLYNYIADLYVDKVNANVVDASLREKYLEITALFVSQKIFEAVNQGYITFDPRVSTENAEIPTDLIEECKPGVIHMISSLPNLCRSINTVMLGTISHMTYVVNARITEKYVIPYPNHTIPVRALPAMWEAWETQNPSLNAKLLQLGVYNSWFKPWSAYDSNYILGTEDYRDAASFTHYYKKANLTIKYWDPKYVFTHPTRICEMMTPGLYLDGLQDLDNDTLEEKLTFDEFDYEGCEKSDVPCNANSFVRLGFKQDITADNYTFLLKVDTKEREDQYIQYFRGFSLDAVLTVDHILDKLPSSDTAKRLTVIGNNIFTLDTKEKFDFTRIAELASAGYPVVKLYDRNWILADYRNNYWEARV